jgi:hypothetical protein
MRRCCTRIARSIDGYGRVALVWERFSAADALVYIDLPLLRHRRWMTKRLVRRLS